MSLSGKSKFPILLIHGGAGKADIEPEIRDRIKKGMEAIITRSWDLLKNGAEALETVCTAVEHLEQNAYFNAGYGAVLQQDGLARLSASLMDGARGTFSAVSQATHIIHPSKLARALQDKDYRVLSGIGVQLLSRELGIAPANPNTPYRMSKLISRMNETTDRAGFGTVGAVAIDENGNLASATSTGGGGGNFPGRMSDVPTVAANYASTHAAISCTGIGEQIIDHAVAARLETRVRDGMTVIEASDRAEAEAKAEKKLYGWIACDAKGNWVIRYTTEAMNAAQISADNDLLIAER